MRTTLFTSEPTVIKVVQEVDPNVTVHEDSAQKGADADLYIWDLDLASEVPAWLLNAREHMPLLLLVSQKNMHVLETGMPARCCALVKPINTYTVRAFLELAQRNHQLFEQARQGDQLRSEREVLLQYALAANLKLQEYDHERTNFLARALHDLRAPLTALHGYCGLLAAGELGPVSPQQRELLTRMQTSTRRLARQSTGMFELAIRGRSSKRSVRAVTDIEEAIVQAVHEVYPQLEDKNQEISLNLAAPEGAVFTNSAEVTQVFLNLLENCSKFTPAGGQIDVNGYTVAWNFANGREGAVNNMPGNAYRIDVRDTGPGIEPAVLSAIFEQYTSYSNSHDRSGGGLGLAICKMIVTDHDGLIWAENSECGAVFSVVLPFGSVPPAHVAPDLPQRVAIQ